ncbi:MAG: hypothetical protein QF652_08405, partial [Dehalococcoidia bacterium]|nr:hypothetical protein [Dehalococcoidia bacterium]
RANGCKVLPVRGSRDEAEIAALSRHKLKRVQSCAALLPDCVSIFHIEDCCGIMGFCKLRFALTGDAIADS